MSAAEILRSATQDMVIGLVMIVVLIGIFSLILTADYEPRWNNTKKPRVFRERI